MVSYRRNCQRNLEAPGECETPSVLALQGLVQKMGLEHRKQLSHCLICAAPHPKQGEKDESLK